MLDEHEFSEAERLYRKMFDLRKNGHSREEAALPLLQYYSELTGFVETEPNAIMHHRLSLYGPPCDLCGNPYRTPLAMICAACGNERSVHE